jgi:hypothetical protein
MVKKKGQGLSFTMIIIASLGVLVLIVVGFIFKESILHSVKGFKDTSDKALDQADGGTCESLFDGAQKCANGGPSSPGNWVKVSGTFSDCDKNEQCYRNSGTVKKKEPVAAAVEK